MPRLMLGPMLRYVDETEAVFWVETDEACEVEVLGSADRTFHVAGHHYALVRAEGLEPATWHEYEVRLDGEVAWPPPESDFPPSQFRTYPNEAPIELAFGSCRIAAPNHEPWDLAGDEHPYGYEEDALHALALRMMRTPREQWPDVLLMLGDQVYADEVSPLTSVFVESRRSAHEPHGDCIHDFEEYTRLYYEAWSEPTLRWLLSTISTAMIFDDHDVHDDWNISKAWLDERRSEDWWDEHIVGALGSYWIYQHLGNLAPGAHADDELLSRVKEAEDGWPLLEEFAYRADRETSGTRWSYCRDLGGTRLVVIDSRAGRVLDGRRSMLDDAEWDWVAEHATGGFDHLIIATSLPFLLAPGMHHVEAWNEAVCDGAWGSFAARLGERVRQAMDMEHWAAFDESFDRLAELQRSVGAGERGTAPASIVTLSGDVHHAYLAEVAFRRGSGVASSVWQATCSPFRNPLERKERRAIKALCSRGAEVLARLLARSAGQEDPDIRWRFTGGGPWFENQVATLTIDGRRLDLRIEKTLREDPEQPALEKVLQRRLA